jgi:hypothetical protein
VASGLSIRMLPIENPLQPYQDGRITGADPKPKGMDS